MRRYSLALFFSFIIYCTGQDLQEGLQPPSGYWNNTFIKLYLALGLVDLVDLSPEIPPSIEIFSDIVFKETEQRPLKLDIYRKKNIHQPAPVIIFIHGGSWKTGNKKDYLIYLLHFAEKGYITASLSYRFFQEAIFPAAVEDVRCGVNWIKKHGTNYGMDTNKIVLVGGSAGAHLAMMLGYSQNFQSCDTNNVSPRVQGVVNIYGPVDLTTDFAIAQPVLPEFIGDSYENMPTGYQDASPIRYISDDDPPTLTFHGTIDNVVPVGQADMLDKKLNENHIFHEYHRLKGWPHTMDLAVSMNNYMKFYMYQFFKKVIPLNL